MVTTLKVWTMCVVVCAVTSLYTSLAQQQQSSFRQQSLPGQPRQQQHQSLLGQQRQQQQQPLPGQPQQERQERRAVREQQQLSKPVGQQLHHQRLAIWIDKKEIEHYAGVPMDIFVVYDGAVQTYLQDSHFIDAQLPVLPPEVYRVKISWMAPDDVYLYRFTTLKSNQPHILYDPLLSISPYGTIPREKGDFEITIPCTGKVTGLASMNLVLRVDDFQGRPIDGSPIKLQLRKRCIVVESKTMCKETCKNGGNCNQHGQCDCTPGYFGPQCQLAACFPDCMNNGSCVKPNQCMCREGFLGFRCESAICKRPCENGGRCSKPNQCECTSGYYGDFCQNRVGLCSVPCKNGGTCTKDNKCDCLQGYMGLFCQIPICTNSCGVYGHCVGPDTCQCKKGWRGKQCNKNGAKRKKRGPKRRHLKSKKLNNSEQPQTVGNTGDTSKVTHKVTKNRKRSQHKGKVVPTTL